MILWGIVFRAVKCMDMGMVGMRVWGVVGVWPIRLEGFPSILSRWIGLDWVDWVDLLGDGFIHWSELIWMDEWMDGWMENRTYSMNRN